MYEMKGEIGRTWQSKGNSGGFVMRGSLTEE
jgi:hypothetical protein